MADQWITTGDAARHLGVSTETIRRYIKEGRLRAHVITGGGRVRIRIRRADLAMFHQRYVRNSITDEWES